MDDTQNNQTPSEEKASTPEMNGGNKKMHLVFFVVALLLVGGFYFSRQSGETEETNAESTEMMAEEESAVPEEMIAAEPPPMPEAEVKTFTIGGKNFAFDMPEIRVKQGDTVKVILRNDQGFHDFVIDEFNARTEQIKEGNTTEVEFVVDKVGEFEYYCSVGQHRKMGMKGKLIVEE